MQTHTQQIYNKPLYDVVCVCKKCGWTFTEQFRTGHCTSCNTRNSQWKDINTVLDSGQLIYLNDIQALLWDEYETIVRSLWREWILFTNWKSWRGIYSALWWARDNVGKKYIMEHHLDTVVYLVYWLPIPFFLARKLVSDLRIGQYPQRKERKPQKRDWVKKVKRDNSLERKIRRFYIDMQKCHKLEITEWDIYETYLDISDNEWIKKEFDIIKVNWSKRLYNDDYPEVVSYITKV